MGIQMNVVGKIGEKLELSTNYNNAPTFDFDNQLKLQYDSDAFSEDDIVKKIEAGDVSLPLRGNLIQGSQRLFGIKTELQFGYLRLTAIASQQKSKNEQLTIENGSLIQEFEIRPDQYDENRHFFLSHYSRDIYEPSLSQLPNVRSLFKLDQVEVWITNDETNVQASKRFIVAIADLGENKVENFTSTTGPSMRNPNPPVDFIYNEPLPDNSSNRIYEMLLAQPDARNRDNVVNTLKAPPYQFEQTRDFESIRARLLSPSEYTVNRDMGFISLNIRPQPDQTIAVAYRYTFNGETYQVGELSSDVEENSSTDSTTLQTVYVKLLKGSTQSTELPTWDLMMKNVYPLRTLQLSQEDFKLDVFYEADDGKDKRFIPEMTDFPLINLFNLDNLNSQGDPQPDGIFDYVPGLTLIPSTGSIIFPSLEPFGSSLQGLVENANNLSGLGLSPADITAIVDQYSYQELYDQTITRAREKLDRNRFVLKGEYKSSTSSEISLGAFNIPQGSVTVRAGGQVLREGVDYEVDYNIGRVRILNEQYLQSGVPVNVSFEDNTLFSFQQKTMLGLRADYEVSKNLSVGATYMHLFEKPYTQKVNIGDDPINNRIFGLDFNFSKEMPGITRFVDNIPGLETKAASNMTLMAEAAALVPGHSRAINQKDSEGGVVYLDDFEGSTSGFDLRSAYNRWVLASVPQGTDARGFPLFPEAELNDDPAYGANRAKLAWYRIERAQRTGADQNNPYTRAVDVQEIFRNKSRVPGINPDIFTFDLTYFPNERGPYNFDVPGGTAFSAGIDPDLNLLEPQTRWAGIMRRLNTNDFEAANFEFLEFWVLNPFMAKSDGTPIPDSGRLVFNFGTLSEDILKDSRQFFENGLPVEDPPDVPTTFTNWGRIPTLPPEISAFDVSNRDKQDLGLDGLDDAGENETFSDYVTTMRGFLNPDKVGQVLERSVQR